MNKLDIEQYLRKENKEGKTEFRLVVSHNTEEGIVIYMHPLGKNGETFDAIITDGQIILK